MACLYSKRARRHQLCHAPVSRFSFGGFQLLSYRIQEFCSHGPGNRFPVGPSGKVPAATCLACTFFQTSKKNIISYRWDSASVTYRQITFLALLPWSKYLVIFWVRIWGSDDFLRRDCYLSVVIQSATRFRLVPWPWMRLGPQSGLNQWFCHWFNSSST